MNFLLAKTSFCSVASLNSTILSIYSYRIPHLAEKLCLCFEYLQLFSMIIIIPASSTESISTAFSSFYVPIFKLLCPGFMIDPSHNIKTILITWFFVVLTMFLLKYMFVAYTISLTLRQEKLPQAISKIWSWIFLLQGRILFAFLGSFYSNISGIAINNDLISIGWAYSITVISLTLLLIEFCVCLMQGLLYSYHLPNKQFLSSKTSQVEMITLAQKGIILMLFVFLPEKSETTSWTFVIMNFLINILRNIIFYQTLPPYRLKTIFYQGILITTMTSLSLCYIVKKIADLTYTDDVDAIFVPVMFLVLTPIILKANTLWISSKTHDLYINSLGLASSVEILLQKVRVIKTVQNQKGQLYKNNEKNSWLELIFNTVNENVNNIFYINKHTDLNIQDKDGTNRIFSIYLENIVAKYPHSRLAKLYLAYYYGLKLKCYGSALKLLREIEQSCSFKMAFNVFLLRNKLQENLKANEKSAKRPLDLYDFIYSTSIVQTMKQKMVEQADLQIKLCQEQTSNNSNLFKILQYSQQIESYRQSMSKEVTKTLNNIPDYFIEPMLVSAYYHLRLNFSSSGSFRAYESFSRKYKKYHNLYRAETLCQENLFDKNKVLFTLKTLLESLGTIANCSKSVEDILGLKTISLKGGNLWSFMPPVLAECFMERLKSILQTEGKNNLHNIIRSFAKNKSGFLIRVDYYFGVHPFIAEELYLDLILRPVPDTKEYMIVDKDGIIQAGTEGIYKKLVLNKYEGARIQGTNVGSLSQDLKQLNQACDIIAYNSSDKDNVFAKMNTVNMNMEYAKTLFEKFQTSGQILGLKPQRKPKGQICSLFEDMQCLYYCKVELEVHPTTYFKIFIFEKAEGEGKTPRKLQNLDEKYLHQIKKTSIEYTSPKLDNPNTDLDDLEDFRLDNEKESGWIDFGRFNSEHEGPSSGRVFLTTEKDQSSATRFFPSSRFALYEKERLLAGTTASGSIPEHQRLKEAANTVSSPNKSLDSPMKQMSIDKGGVKQHVANIMKIRHSFVGSQTSLSSEHEKVENMFSDALNAKYYPKIYKVYILAVYAVLLALFITRLALQLASNEALVLIDGRRVILGNAQSLSELFGRIQRNVRLVADFNQDVLNESLYAKYSATTQSLLSAIGTSLDSLAQTNIALFDATSSISPEDRAEFFGNSIPIYESYYNEPVEMSPSTNLFSATTRVYESGVRALHTSKTNVTLAVLEFKFILRNALNDILISSLKTSDSLYKMSLQEIDSSQETTLVVLIVMQTSIVGIIVWSAVIIIKQCQSEILNLKEFVNINRESVAALLAKIIEFRTLLHEGGSFENARPIDSSEYMDKFLNYKSKGIARRLKLGEANASGIFVRYLVKLLKLSSILVMLSGFSAGSYVQNKRIFDFTKTKLSQIYFIRKAFSHTSLATTVFIELFSENNRTLIVDEPVAGQLGDAVDEITSIITDIPVEMKLTNSKYDQIVYQLLYKDGCALLSGAAYTRCIGDLQGRTVLNVINSVSDFKAGLKIANDEYMDSNKTDDVMKTLMLANFPGVIIPGRAALELLNYTAYSLDQGFEDVIIQVKKQKDALDITVEVVVIISGVVLWVWILRKLLQVENKFKKVLKTLPENLIMSNYVLRAYLFRTSKNFLASLKNNKD